MWLFLWEPTKHKINDKVKKMMIRNTTTIILSLLLLAGSQAAAQKRLVEQVQQDINNMSLTVDNYKDAVNKIAPALTHEETKDDAEAWYTAGNVNLRLYDKCLKLKAVGQGVDETLMYRSLINGYDNMRQALKLDSVVVRDKHGNPKTEKDGSPKIKTKYSKKIIEAMQEHFDDYRLGGSVFYVNLKDYKNAYRAWDIYTSMPYMTFMKRSKFRADDKSIGKYCYMKGVAAMMAGSDTLALPSFLRAIKLGYDTKDVFDFAISCAEEQNAEEQLVELVKQAYEHYGKDDPKYITFLINYAITNKHYENATRVIDMAIAEYPNNAEYYDLKGVLVENQTGNIENSYEYFRKCLEIDPEHIRGNFDMGRYYYNIALKIEQDPAASNAEILDKFAKAKPYLEKAYKAQPSNTAAKDALKSIYYHLGDAEKLEELEQD